MSSRLSVVSFLLGLLGCLIALMLVFPPSASASHVSAAAARDAVTTTPPGDDDPRAPDEDILENDVTDAVARYRLDSSGMLYEVHSPQTEVPRLRAPKG